MSKNFVIDRKNFSNAVNIAGSLAGLSKVLPIESYVKLTFSNNNLIIRSTDTESFMRTSIPVETNNESVEICINKASLVKALNVIYDDELTLSIDDNLTTMTINHSSGVIDMPAMDAMSFPSVTLTGESQSVTVPSDTLYRFIKEASNFISGDLMTNLNGIYLYVRNGVFGVCATDKNIVYMNSQSMGYDSGYNIGVIIGSRSFKPIMDLCMESDNVMISFREKNAMFVAGEYSICSRLIEGNFPPFDKIIPTSYEHTLFISKKLLLNAINRIRISVNDNNLSVLSFEGEELNYYSEDLPLNKRTVEKIKYDGNINLKVGVSVSYLYKALSVIHSDIAEIRLISNRRPIVLFDSKEENKLVMCMPMILCNNE